MDYFRYIACLTALCGSVLYGCSSPARLANPMLPTAQNATYTNAHEPRAESQPKHYPVADSANDISHANQLLTIAKSLIGTRYRYGGNQPQQGFDCSGFVFYTHQQLGISLPRTSRAQYRASRAISREQLQPGDLVFFQTRQGRIHHVGIYLGNDLFIHAPGRGKVISITDLDNSYWKPRFVRGGRIAIFPQL